MFRALAALTSAVAALAAPAGTAATNGTKLDTTVTMSDGVKIAVTFYEPAGTPPTGGWPAVMMFHGLGQTRESFDLHNWSANRVAETYLVPDGFAVLTFDARAHGQSGGLFSLDGPRELQDTRELYAWLTSHAEVDASRVGAFGVSYGGGMVWLAAVGGVPFKAIAVAATWTDLQQAFAPQGLGRAGVILGFSQDIPQSRYAPGLADLLRNALGGENLQSIRAFLAQRSTRTQLGGLTRPVFMLQGRRDFAFDADQALAAFRLLPGPKRLYLGDLGHTPASNPPDEVPHFADEVRSWFDRFLKGVPNGIGAKPEVELAADPWSGKTVTFAGLPPTRTRVFKFTGSGTLTAEGKVVRTTTRVGHLETFGAPVVRAQVSSSTGYAHLAVVLSAVRPDGTELVVTDGGAATPTLGRRPRIVTIRLPNEITSIPRNARLRITVAATSSAQNLANLVYLNPVAKGSIAKVGRVTLALSLLKKPVSP